MRRQTPGILGPGIAVLIVLATLLGLGKWQLDRKVWKEGLIDAVTQRLAAAPTDLPPPTLWPQLTADKDEFRRVRASAQFLPGEMGEALVFTSGSNFRPDVSGPGHWVMALTRVFLPAQIIGGTIVVNRGFVPEGRREEAADAAPPGAVDIVGTIRWPELPARSRRRPIPPIISGSLATWRRSQRPRTGAEWRHSISSSKARRR